MVYSSSFSLDTTNPLIPVAREFIDVDISPYIQNEFLFIGFAERPNVIRNHTQLPSALLVSEQQIIKKFLSMIWEKKNIWKW